MIRQNFKQFIVFMYKSPASQAQKKWMDQNQYNWQKCHCTYKLSKKTNKKLLFVVHRMLLVKLLTSAQLIT